MSAERSWYNIFFRGTNFSHEKCSEISPEIFDPFFVGPNKSPQNSRQISRKNALQSKNALQKIKKIRRRASAGAQGEVIPFEKKLLPTGIIILRNYLEIGNALPYRKNCFQELFGSVIPIKSVMDKLAGNFFFQSLFFLAGCSGYAAHPPPPPQQN